MERNEPNPASAKEQAEGSRENVNLGEHDDGGDDFREKSGLEGKTDSGPEPDVFPRNIPPPD